MGHVNARTVTMISTPTVIRGAMTRISDNAAPMSRPSDCRLPSAEASAMNTVSIGALGDCPDLESPARYCNVISVTRPCSPRVLVLYHGLAIDLNLLCELFASAARKGFSLVKYPVFAPERHGAGAFSSCYQHSVASPSKYLYVIC